MGIRITAMTDGFRRCGVAHPAAPTTYPDDKFTAKELKILDGERMLKVERVKDKKPAGGAPGPGGGNKAADKDKDKK